MAEVLPFRATCYNSNIVPDLTPVVTQPYDKITPQMQADYYQASPYNLVRVLLGRKEDGDNSHENVYTRSGAEFRKWVDEDIMTSEPLPAFFAYFQEYDVPGQPGERVLRKGFVGLGRLEDYDARVVHRHEQTLSGPKKDRLELLKATRAHFGQLFMLYSDPKGEIDRILDDISIKAPWKDLTDEYGVRHIVWRARREQEITTLSSRMRDKPLIIADGHHRYETALAYRDLCREQGDEDRRAEFAMMTFVRQEDEGLLVLPTHRLVQGLKGFSPGAFRKKTEALFEIKDFSLPADNPGAALRERLSQSASKRAVLAAVAESASKAMLLRLRKDADLAKLLPDCPAQQRDLDVVILHRLVLEKLLGISQEAVVKQENLRYVREHDVGIEAVTQSEGQICFFLNPTPIEKVRENALAGLPLPQKSTDFYPKMLSGLTAYWLDNPLGI